MAANVDVSSLSSAADIFSGSHTLPQIRAIHRALHIQAEEKAGRLRTQVGSSYRELLGTADTIVRMRGDNEQVQAVLGDMGAKCGRSVVASKAASLERFVRGRGDTEQRLERAARLRVLDACGLVAGRVLRGGAGLPETSSRGDRLVLASKVLVLIRLLSKSLGGEAAQGRVRRDIEASLDGARRRLLQRHDTDIDDVQKALCAYSLATSSGARDVLRHFLRVRGEAMAMCFEVDEDEHELRREDDVLRSLRLYTQTLLDVQALVPAKLSQSLAALKGRALLADPSLLQLEGLRLDVHKQWCGDEILYFTPFIRHDDLDRDAARDMLSNWASHGGDVLVRGLRQTLAHMTEFKSVIDLRTSVLQHWIREGGKARGLDPSEMQDSLRDAINDRLLALVDAKVRKLRIVGSEVRATLEAWRDGVTDARRGLWGEGEDADYDAALSAGAGSFIEEVVARLYGHNDAVSKASHCYASWYHVIGDVTDVVQSLTKQRWDNDDDEEIEDEETLEARQELLSKEDPERLRRKLDTSLDTSFEELEEQLRKLWEERRTGPRGGPVAIYLLRILRDIRKQLPQRDAIQKFGLAMVPSLHETLAVSVSTGPVAHFTETALASRTVDCRPLWEGEEPALPVQPSPGLFLFLRDLSTSMGDAGMDLWSPKAVQVLRQRLLGSVAENWTTALDAAEMDFAASHEKKKEKAKADDKEASGLKKGSEGKEAEHADEKQDDDDDEKETEEIETQKKEEQAKDEDGADGAGDSSDNRRDLYVQWVFDLALLHHCLGQASGDALAKLEALQKTITRHAEVDQTSRDRMAKSAEQFWQRTSLLFGLLA
jgi:conserved oligomeric Golgi complex subunit 1